MNKATGTFEVESKSEPYHEAGGVSLFRSTYKKTFHGDLEGSSSVEVLRAMSPVDGSAGYVGIERFTGTLHGKSGSFVLQHSGMMARGEMSLSVTVVPDTGTSELKGLRGEMAIKVADGEHSYDLDYEIEQ